VTETVLPPSWDGSVVLDIGGEVGALILRTSSACFAREFDLIPDNANAPHVHSAVRERRAAGGSSFAAVYPQLQEGSYRIEGTTQHVAVRGGRVIDVELDEQ
jgi:hypothetical protein